MNHSSHHMKIGLRSLLLIVLLCLCTLTGLSAAGSSAVPTGPTSETPDQPTPTSMPTTGICDTATPITPGPSPTPTQDMSGTPTPKPKPAYNFDIPGWYYSGQRWIYNPSEFPEDAPTSEKLLELANNRADYRNRLTVEYDEAIVQDWHFREWLYTSYSNYGPELSHVNLFLPVEMLRKMNGTEYYYVPYKIKGGGLLYLFFEQPGKKGDVYLYYSLYCEKTLKLSDFDVINIGDSVDAVITLDPVARFQKRSGYDATASSTIHILQDGLLYIPYENDTVRGRVFMPNDDYVPSYRRILPQDFPDAPRPGDTNGDGTVDIEDLLAVIAHIFEKNLLAGNNLMAAQFLAEDGITVDIEVLLAMVDIIFSE